MNDEEKIESEKRRKIGSVCPISFNNVRFRANVSQLCDFCRGQTRSFCPFIGRGLRPSRAFFFSSSLPLFFASFFFPLVSWWQSFHLKDILPPGTKTSAFECRGNGKNDHGQQTGRHGDNQCGRRFKNRFKHHQKVSHNRQHFRV